MILVGIGLVDRRQKNVIWSAEGRTGRNLWARVDGTKPGRDGPPLVTSIDNACI